MLQGKSNDVKQHRWFETFDWDTLAARKVTAPRKPRDDAAKRIRELAVRGCICCCKECKATHGMHAERACLGCLQDSERKQRSQPKETPEELAEAEAVFADF